MQGACMIGILFTREKPDLVSDLDICCAGLHVIIMLFNWIYNIDNLYMVSGLPLHTTYYYTIPCMH